jgi:hypothetical protein
MRFFFILFFLPLSISAQVKIDKAGDFWEANVDSALKKIKIIDSNYYTQIIEVCDQVSFWNNNFSSCEGLAGSKGIILISAMDIRSKNIDNVCAVLVHESLHLKFLKMGMTFGDPAEEEVLCYLYELDFLKKIPDVNKGLIRHAETQIKKFSYR